MRLVRVNIGWCGYHHRRESMNRAIIALTLLVFFAAGLAPAFAAEQANKSAAKPAAHKKVVSGVCPVMGTKIPDVSRAPGGKSVYKGKTYYFCCAECKPKFDKNPEKYIKKTSVKKEPSKKK
jgi:YHS domain-containing protein